MPSGKNNFDIFSFLEFADSITKKYEVVSCNSKGKIGLKIKAVRNDLVLLDSGKKLISFLIIITENCSKYSVFIRDGICKMGKGVNNMQYCIVLMRCAFQSSYINFFKKGICWDSNLINIEQFKKTNQSNKLFKENWLRQYYRRAWKQWNRSTCMILD